MVLCSFAEHGKALHQASVREQALPPTDEATPHLNTKEFPMQQNGDGSASDDDIAAIYRQLRKGLGHERVNDGNVFALIELAALNGHRQLETELREWQAPCSDGSEGVPSTIAPTRGFNRENAKH